MSYFSDKKKDEEKPALLVDKLTLSLGKISLTWAVLQKQIKEAKEDIASLDKAMNDSKLYKIITKEDDAGC